MIPCNGPTPNIRNIKAVGSNTGIPVWMRVSNIVPPLYVVEYVPFFMS